MFQRSFQNIYLFLYYYISISLLHIKTEEKIYMEYSTETTDGHDNCYLKF